MSRVNGLSTTFGASAGKSYRLLAIGSVQFDADAWDAQIDADAPERPLEEVCGKRPDGSRLRTFDTPVNHRALAILKADPVPSAPRPVARGPAL